MNKKNILIIVAIIVILVIITVIILIQKDKVDSTSSLFDQKKVSEKEISEIEEKEEIQTDPTAILKSQLGLQARSFMARYGTYSSDNRYDNLKMLLPQMSIRLAQEATKEISLNEETQGLISLTTKVINFRLKDFDKESKIIFITQVQEQEINNEKTNLKQREVEVVFIKENSQWKVDEVNYKN